ncbi:MAG: ABC transporter permease, partial [Candidatus Aminicenantes bacterium]|nr:ABC transporter permease [Candidatus Aminicenantes bacterium]
LVRAGSMIMKINFSRKSLVIAAFAQCLVAFAVQWLLALLLCLVSGVIPSLWIAFLPLLLLPLALTTLGLGFILSILNGIMRDVGNALGVLMTFLMFLTPVLYPRPPSGLLARITAYNPLYFLVSVPRDLALTGRTTEWNGFWISAAVGVAVFLICIYGFHLAETRVTERV